MTFAVRQNARGNTRDRLQEIIDNPTTTTIDPNLWAGFAGSTPNGQEVDTL